MPRFAPGPEPDELELDELDVPEFHAASASRSSTASSTASSRRTAPPLTFPEADDELFDVPEFSARIPRNTRQRETRRSNARSYEPTEVAEDFGSEDFGSEDFRSELSGDDFPVESPRRAPRAASARRAPTAPTSRSPKKKSASRPAISAASGSASGSAARSSGGRSRSTHSTVRTTPPRALNYEVTGVLTLVSGILLFYNALRPEADGFFTRVVIAALRGAFGIGSIVVPALMCALGVLLILRRHHTNLRAFGRGIIVGLLVLLTAVHLMVPVGDEFRDLQVLYTHGGAVGGAITWILRRAVGEIGAVILLIGFSLVALLFFTEISLSEIVARSSSFLRLGAGSVRDKTSAVLQRGFTLEDFTEDEEDDLFVEDEVTPSRRRRALPEEVLQEARRGTTRSAKDGRPSPFFKMPELEDEIESEEIARAATTERATPPNSSRKKTPPAAATEIEAPRIEIIDTPPPPSVIDGEPPASTFNAPQPMTVHTPLENRTASTLGDDDLTPTEALEAQAMASAGNGESSKPARPQKIRRHFGDGPLMPEYFDDAIRSLDPPLMPDVAGVEEDIAQGVQAVQETLAAFKIDARVTDVKRGPVITRYEVQPAPGVRVASIANLDRDMARSLSAIAVRIEAPVPGKNVVGIEVPNKRVHLVRLRDVLELPEFLASPSRLSFVLGKDIAGQPKWADLTKMPHMLVAGATNSGKSVCLNAIISSIITRAAPDEVKFSLIDPKRVELTLYRGIPHLYHDVVVEPKDAVKVLRGMIMEMDRRYKKFAERGVRNIVSFNSKLEPDEKPLPYIVIVIDELADLMMTAAAEFEKLICRLAQLARATGIHLIVATQRPSVNVITGVIKANIPARVAFAVASQVDSRTILDAVGAERLIGSGDMLFDANNGGKAVRIQGAYLSEEEVNRIVEVVKHSYHEAEDFEYGLDLNALEDDDETGSEKSGMVSDDKRDELFDEIREFVLRHQEMSASLIQRKFEIGFPRAGRIVDQLERSGILGPADGPKPRKVLGPGRDG